MPFSIKRVIFGLWIALFGLLAVFWYYPVLTGRTRFLILGVAFLLLAGSIIFSWKRTVLRNVLLAFYIILTAFLSLPGSTAVDRSELAALYGKSLTSYLGSKYVWGGEGVLGIDCSGLARRALEDTLISQGFRTLNPYLVREGIKLWWNDCTARDMGNGADDRTTRVTHCQTLNILDHAALHPGDLAVTESGIHVMIYLGNATWIGADPSEEKVTKFSIPEQRNGYFSTPMQIVRWRILGDPL